jgi:hypothetical protein
VAFGSPEPASFALDDFASSLGKKKPVRATSSTCRTGDEPIQEGVGHPVIVQHATVPDGVAARMTYRQRERTTDRVLRSIGSIA